MSDKCSVDSCNVGENGTCALHGIEVERRKNLELVVKNQSKSSKILTRMIWVMGGGYTLVIAALGASFIYTSDINQQAINRSHLIVEMIGNSDEKLTSALREFKADIRTEMSVNRIELKEQIKELKQQIAKVGG